MPDNTDDKTALFPRPFVWAWLALLMAISAYIRVHGADQYHFNNDEAMHFNIASGKSLTEVLRLSLYETHPPMLYVLLHYWLMISDSPAFARGLSLLFGLTTIPLTYRIGRLLNGELTGMIAAALVAFSSGCIIQSYEVRHYAILLFFLSCSFYCYLVWRKGTGRFALTGYCVFACIACLTHFSGILAIFCLFVDGMISLKPRVTGWKRIGAWALANLIPAMVTMLAYALWQPTLLCVKAYVDAGDIDPLIHAPYAPWKSILFYPIEAAVYLYSNPAEALILLFLPFLAGWKNAALRPFLVLSGIALALGMALLGLKIYYLAGARHYMWSFPLLIPPAAWVLSDLCMLCGTVVAGSPSRQWNMAVAVLLLATGGAMYDPIARFSDISEYQVPQAQWQAFMRYADTLGPDDLIVANRDDAILLANIYPYFDAKETGCMTPGSVVTVPFGHTHILFSRAYLQSDTKIDFLSIMLKAAEVQGLLDGINRLVFYQTQWTFKFQSQWALIINPSPDICPVPEKHALLFPQTNPGSAYNKRRRDPNYAKLLIVPKQGFFQEVVSSKGGSHNCIISGDVSFDPPAPQK